MSKFEDNGGYYIDGVPYMDCKYTGEPVRNVSTDCKYVVSDKALQAKMYKMFPEDFENKTKRNDRVIIEIIIKFFTKLEI